MAKDLISTQEEGETPLDDISGLRINVKTRQELNDAEAANNVKAYSEYLLFTKNTVLTFSSLCHIHKDMFDDVWDWAGIARKSEKNLGVSPAKIGSEIHRLLYDFHQWEEKKMPPREIAVRIHHRFAQIHPFENGNGRWARLVTNIYLHQSHLPVLQWPTQEKHIRESFRPRYLSALRSADSGDYGLLTKIHSECGR